VTYVSELLTVSIIRAMGSLLAKISVSNGGEYEDDLPSETFHVFICSLFNDAFSSADYIYIPSTEGVES
jgi:hypothetical protein